MKNLGHNAYRKIARVAVVGVLALTLLAGISIAPAQAQVNGRWNHSNNNSNRWNNNRSDVIRFALANGYSDGFEQGQRDRRGRQRFEYRRNNEYNKGMNGFDRRWNSYQRDYQTAYRKGFLRGYDDGFYGRNQDRGYYRNRDQWYRNGRYDYDTYYQNSYYSNDRGDLSRDDVAERGARAGYQTGFQWGQYDAQRRNRMYPQGHGAYQFGFDGYDPDWGSASTYQQAYKAYFLRGYEDGYNRRSNNWRYDRRF